MASEIRVDKITSLSGVGTITPSSSGIDITGITTVATLKATTGIVTTLTATTGIVTTLTANTVTSLGAVSGTTGTFTSGVTLTGNITCASGDLQLVNTGDDINLYSADDIGLFVQTNETAINCIGNGAVEVYHDNNKKIVTTSQGAAIGQVSTIPSMDSFSCQIQAGNSGFLGNYHSGSNQQFIIGLNQYYQGGYRAPDNNVSQHLQLYNKKFNFLTAPAPGSDNAVVTSTNILTIDDDGVKFGTDTAAANALDDYEEGNWTPVISNASSGGTTVTSAQRHGRYTKIGRVVYLQFYTWSLETGPSGSIFIQGLPFACVPTMSFIGSVAGRYYNEGLDNYYNLTCRVNANNSYASFEWSRSSNGDAVAATFGGFVNYYTNFTGHVTYLTNS